jgi:hypothetical protein
MAKRKDIRIALDPSLERLVITAADADVWVKLAAARAELAGVVAEVSAALDNLPGNTLSTFAETAARASGRKKGVASIEVDPDGSLVLVFSYGGAPRPALARDETGSSWSSALPSLPEARSAATAAGVDVSDCGRNITAIIERVAAQGRSGTRPRPGGGFIKTAPAVAVKHQDDDLDHLFDDDPPASPKPGRLTALAAKAARVDLGPILDSD